MEHFQVYKIILGSVSLPVDIWLTATVSFSLFVEALRQQEFV